MPNFIKIYHYSPKRTLPYAPFEVKLDELDPAHRGEGATSTRKNRTAGLPVIHCYTHSTARAKVFDHDQEYELYMPKEWNIYDLGQFASDFEEPFYIKAKEILENEAKDERKLRQEKARIEWEIKQKNTPEKLKEPQEPQEPHVAISDAAILEKRELLIKEKYEGYMNSKNAPNELMLFNKISTKKPVGDYVAYSWHGMMLENVAPKLPKPLSFNSLQNNLQAINQQVKNEKVDETYASKVSLR